MAKEQVPEVCEHLERLGLRPDMYLLDWIMTLFGRTAPLDLACRLVLHYRVHGSQPRLSER